MSFDLPGATRDLGPGSADPAPRAPWVPAVGAAITALLGAVACAGSLVVEGSSTIRLLAVIGYVLGAIVVTALWSVQRAVTASAAQHTEFRPQPIWSRLALAAMIVGLLAGALSAFALATEIAK